MDETLPTATVRTQVTVPLRFPDGYVATARVHSFHGLVDGREHLAFGLGDRAGTAWRWSTGCRPGCTCRRRTPITWRPR